MRFRYIFSAIRSRITLRLAIILAVVFGLTVPATFLIPYHINSIEIAARARNAEDHNRLVEILSVILSEPCGKLLLKLPIFQAKWCTQIHVWQQLKSSHFPTEKSLLKIAYDARLKKDHLLRWRERSNMADRSSAKSA